MMISTRIKKKALPAMMPTRAPIESLEPVVVGHSEVAKQMPAKQHY